MDISALVDQYWNHEPVQMPGDFEHRFEAKSSAMMYSVIRDQKPTRVLEIGSWRGGSTNIIMAALQKNGLPFVFTCSELMDDLRTQTRANVYRERGEHPLMVGDITQNLDKVPFPLDFVFVDTNHDLSTTVWIVEHVFPMLKPGGILMMHDWAVEDKDGQLLPKGDAWPETTYLLDLIAKKQFPFEKIWFTYHNPGQEETGIWKKV